MNNTEIREIFDLVYNGFWQKYKGMTGEQLVRMSEQLVEDAGKIMTDHDNPMCHAIVKALLDELDGRAVKVNMHES